MTKQIYTLREDKNQLRVCNASIPKLEWSFFVLLRDFPTAGPRWTPEDTTVQKVWDWMPNTLNLLNSHEQDQK